jgi:gluconate 2-dehydrogenase gamma chain
MLRSTRRQFCEHTVLGVGASIALSALGCRSQKSSAGTGTESTTPDSSAPRAFVPKTLGAAGFATLSAVCERVLPRDQDPGAIDLGVPEYIDGMAATPELAPVREMLAKVLPILDKEAGKRFGGKAFVDVEPAQQDAILDTWQHGNESRQHFFDVIVSLTMEGAFGDPKYGGNTGGRGFAMIGFTPDPPLKKMAPMPTMNHAHAPD